MDKNKEKKPVKDREQEDLELDLAEINISDLMPKMEVANPAAEEKEEKPCIVGDEVLLNLYDEILQNCRSDRSSIDEVLTNLVDMVFNDGDSTDSSKEAVVNLIKVKSDISDKMSKVADLMTRIKLKNKDTFPAYLAPQQHNKIVVSSDKREFLKNLSKMATNKRNPHD